jgi:NAD(P)-dependent dehydrogenase (short-subunit alcohol dehydrogenase family)
MSSRLEGRVAIVTGGAQGIGGATARRLAQDGAHTIIVDLNEELATQNVARIEAAGGSAQVYLGDVTKEETARGMVVEAMSRGRLDILVQNAFPVGEGTFGGGVTGIALEDWRAAMSVLLDAVFLGAKHAVPAMEKSGPAPGFDASPYGEYGLHEGAPPPMEVGRIVNMSSIHGLLQASGVPAYDAGKAAVIGLTRQMAVEYGPTGITVNAIAPGHIITEKLQKLWEEMSNPAGYRLFELQYPVRRMGRPEDVANGVAFLCSSEASFITGVTLPIDGGHSVQLQENIVVEMKDFIQENPGLKTHFDEWGADLRRR